MCLILSGFIVFGRDFITLWAGPGYEEVYIITLMFFVALLIPLIQNLGITILQARNQMKFRSLLYIGIAVVSLIFQIILSKKYGGIGCAISIAGALLLGQGLIMNIYYRKKQELDVLHFWKEILKMSVVPIILILAASYLLPNFALDSWAKLGAAIAVFAVIYIPLFWIFSMNKYEKDLFIIPIKSLINKVSKR